MRAIDANKLIEDIKAIHYNCTGMRAGKTVLSEFAKQYRNDILKTIDNQPTVDAVEVVRCKDCVYNMKNAFGLGIICDKIGAYMPTENSFCSYGAKMEERRWSE